MTITMIQTACNFKSPILLWCLYYAVIGIGNVYGFEATVIENTLKVTLDKMTTVQTADFFNGQPELKLLRSKSIKNIEVKESSIKGAGLGLFAKKNIKANTLVSFYPCHALGIETPQEQIWTYGNDNDYFQQHPPTSSSYLHATDQPLFKRESFLTKELRGDDPTIKDIPIFLDANREKEGIDPLWASQYINDGALVTSNDEQGVNAYYAATKKLKNCIHIPIGPSPVMATVTTKKVKKGEELFTSYGCVYWLGVLYANDGNSGPSINNQIQIQITDSAQDLLASMQSVSVTYNKQIDAMISEFDKL